MSQWLRQGTARVVTFGPFVSKSNGVTLQTGAGIITSIDHATTGILLSKNGGAATIRHQAVTPSTYDAHGFFKVTLDATDTDTLGTLLMMHTEPATYLPVWRVFLVVPAQVWDSLFGTDKLDVAVVEQANIDFGALQKASITAAVPTAASNADAVLDEALGTHTGFLTGLLPAASYTAPSNADIATILAAIQSATYGLSAIKGYVDELESRLTAARAGYLDLINTNLDDKISDIDGVLTAAHGSGDWTTDKTGSSTYTDTITDGTNPIEGVQVELYSDAGYSTLIAVEETDITGSFTFHVNAGVYYCRAIKSGFTFIDWTKTVT